MGATQQDVEELSRAILLPIMLVLDAWVFQYLLSVYWSRRREMRAKMLLVASFLGFASHIYSHESYETMLTFNDISETCIQLTFIIQITIIGRDVAVKVKVRSLVWFTRAAEVLIIVSWLDIIGSVLEIAGVNMGERLHSLENALETISLSFVLVFRFYYLSLSGGLHRVVQRRKVEFAFYSMVATHELPFIVLETVTGVKWEFVQGIFMRMLIVSCILINVIHKARRSGHSTFSVKSGQPSTVAEDDAVQPGSINKLILTIPALVRKASSLKFNVTRAGSSPSIAKIAVGSSRQLQTGNNLEYVVDN